jgi:hypothetical protein
VAIGNTAVAARIEAETRLGNTLKTVLRRYFYFCVTLLMAGLRSGLQLYSRFPPVICQSAKTTPAVVSRRALLGLDRAVHWARSSNTPVQVAEVCAEVKA